MNTTLTYLGKLQNPQHPQTFQITSDALLLLSEGIQSHLSQLTDGSIIHGRKRTNRTANEHFVKSQVLIEKDMPYSGRGEVMPDNRGNLGMLWGPPLLEGLDEYILQKTDEYNEKRVILSEKIKEELSGDDASRVPKKKVPGPGGGPSHQPDFKDSWWIREVCFSPIFQIN